MNIFFLSLSFLVILYIVVCTFKYSLGLVLTSSIVITGSTLANHYGGQSALLLTLIISPVIYVVVTDLLNLISMMKFSYVPVKSQHMEKQPTSNDLVEAAPLSGEWISGKTPEMTFQQPLIGDVKALPRPWL
jgi:hypothetical protein